MRSISFEIPKWAIARVKNNTAEEKDESHREEEEYLGTSLGTGNAWPCYWRSMLIAGYRMVQAQAENHYPCDRQLIFDAILKACPVNCSSIDNSKVPCGQASHLLTSGLRNMTMFFPGLDLLQNSVDEVALYDAKNRSILEMVGLGVIVELAMMHFRFNFSQETIRRLATMLQMLEPYFAYEEKDFEGTPWGQYKGKEMSQNAMTQDQMEDVIRVFVKAAKEPFIIAEFF